jgi:hypothetical protein
MRQEPDTQEQYHKRYKEVLLEVTGELVLPIDEWDWPYFPIPRQGDEKVFEVWDKLCTIHDSYTTYDEARQAALIKSTEVMIND